MLRNLEILLLAQKHEYLMIIYSIKKREKLSVSLVFTLRSPQFFSVFFVVFSQTIFFSLCEVQAICGIL